MALVDYSDSESDSEPPQQLPATKPQPAPTTTTKKPFQKLIDRSGPSAGRILVQLPTATAADHEANDTPEPPAKRARTAGPGTSRFSSFGSLLPPPKKPAAAASTTSSTLSTRTGSAPAPGVHLRTAAEPAFRRGVPNDDGDVDGDGDDAARSGSGSRFGLNLPAPKTAGPSGPTIPEGQKPEEEVKLVGKPLMFKPLSVTRKAAKKKAGVAPAKAPAPVGIGKGVASASASASVAVELAKEAPKKKMSLFSTDDDEPVKSVAAGGESSSGAYEPFFTPGNRAEAEAFDGDGDGDDVTTDYETYIPPPQQPQTQANHSLASITDGMQLSAAAQRELFGRRGNKNNNDFEMPANARVVTFNMEQEYAANEALRASGEQVYNPVRAIAPGKHSLRQVVSMAQNNQTALEDTFAQGRSNRKDAAGRYGWK